MYVCVKKIPFKILSNKELRHLLDISTAVSEFFTVSIALSDAEMYRLTEWYWLLVLLIALLLLLLVLLYVVGGGGRVAVG
jgi:hypothetical protein